MPECSSPGHSEQAPDFPDGSGSQSFRFRTSRAVRPLVRPPRQPRVSAPASDRKRYLFRGAVFACVRRASAPVRNHHPCPAPSAVFGRLRPHPARPPSPNLSSRLSLRNGPLPSGPEASQFPSRPGALIEWPFLSGPAVPIWNAETSRIPPGSHRPDTCPGPDTCSGVVRFIASRQPRTAPASSLCVFRTVCSFRSAFLSLYGAIIDYSLYQINTN